MKNLISLLTLFLCFIATGTQAQQLLCQNRTFQLTLSGQVWVHAAQINNGSSGYVTYSINGQDSILYDCSNVGVDTVFFIGTDALGNSDSCTAIILIQDWIPPVAVCQNITVWLNSLATVVVFPTMISNGSFDNCGISTIQINGQSAVSFGPAQIGTNLVTLSATDINGNSATCAAIVTVMDTIHSYILGSVVLDSNTNCISDANEMGILGAVIHLQSASRNYYFHTDNLGNYGGRIDTGSYTATIHHPFISGQFCQTTQQFTVTNNSTIQVVDWQYQSSAQCPLPTVDIGSAFVRINGLSAYQLRYCNNGTASLQNAYVDISLDPAIIFSSSSITGQALGNNVYRFNVGTLNPGYCGNFNVYFNLMPGVYLGQTHCSEAHIYPDTFCLSGIWNGAEMSVGAYCQNDTVFFVINNNGAAMSGARSYYIYEDSVLTGTANYLLAAGQSLTVLVPAQPGKTYRLIAEQEQGYPLILGDPQVTTFVENCNVVNFPNMSRGFGTNFSNGNSAPFIAVDCRQNIGSYDPNDKSAQPEGYGAAHYIYDNTSIDYTVRFQNTGTDTAFNIYVLDTLSEYLDPTTLQLGSASHSYTWEILADGVLKVNFRNIMLPDSNINEATSHGFFKYRIAQKQGNPLGALIENSAAIYFDNNPPVITNTVFHTIGEDFVQTTAVFETAAKNIDFLIFPNPSSGTVFLQLPGDAVQVLKVFDARGVLLETRNFDQLAHAELQIDYPSGIYFLRLDSERGGVIKKIIKK